MNINWTLLVVILINLTFSTLGDIFAKMWGITGQQKWLYIGLPINVVTIFFYMLIVKLGSLAIHTTIVLIITIIISVSLGFFMFGEKISFSQWLGIAVGLSGIPLIMGL